MEPTSRLELLRNKEKEAQSAIASQEVREHLAGFIRSKRQGSQSQISSGGPTQQQQPAQASSTQNQATGNRSDNNSSFFVTNLISNGPQADHPLRKTASMPTMHIPYKAQSLSRRRQMERRTTMSPLMKRKLKPRRQLLCNSQDSNSAEYSSNPCILHAAQGYHSQSSSPPPPLNSNQVLTGAGGGQQLRHAPNSQQRQVGGIHLSSIYSDRELESLHKASPSASNIQATMTTTASRNSPSSLDSQLRQQQHLRVNEVLRKTVAQSAGGGSLDNEGGSVGSQDSSQATSLPLEHRQWSLDGATAELRAQQQQQLTPGKLLAGSGNLFQREIHRRRLATTSDAATLRRSQSPSSSISMGLTGGQAAASVSSAHQQAQASAVAGRPPAAHHAKHLSSSSSSTSSLLSQQDSFEESSSQAIDLSSSSERHRQLASVSHNFAGFNSNHQHPLSRGHSSQQQQQQRGLHESFRQLQLCHFRGHAPNLLSASKTATSLDAAQCTQQQQQQQQQGPQVPQQVSGTVGSDQFNLSASAQNLLSRQDFYQQQQQQQQQGPSGAELSQWLLAYRSQAAGSSGNEEQQTNNALLAKLAQSDFCRQLPEPYKTNFLAHLLQQQQQLHAARIGAPVDGSAKSLEAHGLRQLQHQEQQYHHQMEQQDPRCFGRTLSSPLLPVGRQRPEAQRWLGAERMAVDGEEEDSVGARVAGARRGHRQTESDSLDLSLTNQSVDSRVTRKPNPKHYQEQIKFQYASRQQTVACSFIYNPQFDERSSTGLTYELAMCNHKCVCPQPEANHPENGLRILAIWRRLYDRGLMARCARIEARQADLEELQLCHSETYACYFGKTPGERVKLPQLDLSKLPIEGLTQLECGGQGADIDTAWNEEQTPAAARLAAGCVIEAASRVAAGRLMNAFAIVRPPGHHAEFQQAMGFCFFNSVAIAARLLIGKHQLARVLIVDWDVHHGNGIQKLFYEEPRVMYISLHRHDHGNFFPGTGDIRETGAGAGEGHNWNIAWSGESMGDAEYLAAFRALVIPVARDFNPSMVLVACGFDAARGHPFNFGGYDLSPACFAHMTRQLMALANGRLVLSLEGGYQLQSICDCAEACLRALLNVAPAENPMDQINECELRREPNQSAVELLLQVSHLAAKFWPSVERWRPSIEQSALDAANVVRDMIK